MSDYVRQFLSQESTAMGVYGEQDTARAFTTSNRGVPFTPVEYARGISGWYYQNLQSLVRQLKGSSNLGRQIAGEVLFPKLAGGIFAFASGSEVGSVFPSSTMAKLGSETSGNVSAGAIARDIDRGVIPLTAANSGIRDAMRRMGESSAKALVAMETATIVKNEAGRDVLDPRSAAVFWEEWGRYAGSAQLAAITPDQPSFWTAIKSEVAELPEEFKDVAEAAGGLAADALVFAGETVGRTAKGFFSSLGIVNGIMIGGAVYIGWKVI